MLGGKTKGQKSTAQSRMTVDSGGPLPSQSLPTPDNEIAAAFIAEHGVEAYYRHLAVRRYYRCQYRRQVADDPVALELIDLLYSEDLTHNNRYHSRAEIINDLSAAGHSRHKAQQAISRLIELDAIDEHTGGGDKITLIYPWSLVDTPWDPPLELRQSLLEKDNLESYYLRLGQAAAAWHYARPWVGTNQRQKILIDRLFETALDGGHLSAQELTFDQELNSEDNYQLVNDLKSMSDADAIQLVAPDVPGGPVSFRLRTFPEINSSTNSLSEMSSGQLSYIARYGIENYWQRQGRLEAAQERALQQANSHLERQIINTLFRLQERSSLLLEPERQELIDLVSASHHSGTDSEVIDALNRLEQDGLITTAPTPGFWADCCSLIDRWKRLDISEDLSRHGPAIIERGLEGYHRNRGRALDSAERFFSSCKFLISVTTTRALFVDLVGQATSDGSPWVSINQLADRHGVENERLNKIFSALKDDNLLQMRPSPGGGQECSLPHLADK